MTHSHPCLCASFLTVEVTPACCPSITFLKFNLFLSSCLSIQNFPTPFSEKAVFWPPSEHSWPQFFPLPPSQGGTQWDSNVLFSEPLVLKHTLSLSSAVPVGQDTCTWSSPLIPMSYGLPKGQGVALSSQGCLDRQHLSLPPVSQANNALFTKC